MDGNRGLPDWWTYPVRCADGHEWGPGRVIVSWLPCQCDPARQAQAKGSGHRMIACRAPGCVFVVYEPPHDPATAGLAQAASVNASRSRSASGTQRSSLGSRVLAMAARG
jgi:hypothetical protein